MIKDLIKISGRQNVLDEKEDLYSYAYGASGKSEHPEIPAAVVLPSTVEEVSKIMKFAYENEIPVSLRCSGTGHESGAAARKDGIVIHFSRMNKILEINKKNLTAKVQAGVILGDFQSEVEGMNLFFPPDPSNLQVSSIGGAISLSSAGARAFKYGAMKDYVLNLKVVLADGRIMITGADTIKNVTGYNLTQLFVGSEGTLGVICEATLRLIPKPAAKKLTLAYFDSIEDAGSAVESVIENLLTPSTLDLIDKNTLQTIEKFCPCGFLTDKEAALFIETDDNNIEESQKLIVEVCKRSNAVKIVEACTKEEMEKLWTARRSAFGAVAKLKPDVVTEDIVVGRDKICEVIRGIQEIAQKYNITTCIMGHAGDGNIHPNFALDMSDEDEKERFEHAKDELFALAISFGGTLSGEHGIGKNKSKYLPMALDETAFEYNKKIKELFDAKGILKTFLP